MRIRLKKNWRGYQKGSILNISDDDAMELIKIRIAVRAKPGEYMRFSDLRRPPVDKMLRGPQERR